MTRATPASPSSSSSERTFRSCSDPCPSNRRDIGKVVGGEERRRRVPAPPHAPYPFGGIDMRDRVANRSEAAAEIARELLRGQRLDGVQHAVASPVVEVDERAEVLVGHGAILDRGSGFGVRDSGIGDRGSGRASVIGPRGPRPQLAAGCLAVANAGGGRKQLPAAEPRAAAADLEPILPIRVMRGAAGTRQNRRHGYQHVDHTLESDG